MKVQAEFSLYPLKTEHLGTAIQAFVLALEQVGLAVEIGQMSSIAIGESDRIFAALNKAFSQIAEDSPCVLLLKISNACPENTSKS